MDDDWRDSEITSFSLIPQVFYWHFYLEELCEKLN